MPWAGVVLSLLVPGLGIARGGSPGKGLAWFLGLELGSGLAGLALVIETVPFALGLCAVMGWLAAVLYMLVQSYRPGRMTGRLWAVFVGLMALTLALPSPVEFVFQPFRMPTNSMRPTLQGGSGRDDFVIVDRFTYRVSSPRRGDLLVFRTDEMPGLPHHQVWVKRLVGLPEERLEIRDGSVFAEGRRLNAANGIPPIHYAGAPATAGSDGPASASYVVDAEGYFVVGDNPTNSRDSRHWGSVPRKNVYGKVTGIYYPFSRAGRLRNPAGHHNAPNEKHPFRSETNPL